jgi:malate synthase
MGIRDAVEIREGVAEEYPDVLTPSAVDVLSALAPLNRKRLELMTTRMERRRRRASEGCRIAFLDPAETIAGTGLTVAEARAGEFDGCEIPADLRRQWVQGTGPGAKPHAALEQSLRNVAYALLSGADGWMFDGEDALGQLGTMSLDNLRNLNLAITRDELFLKVAEVVAGQMNDWSRGFLGHEIVADWRRQLDFTTKIYRARGLHLDDRHVRLADGTGFSASIVDAALYTVNNAPALHAAGASVVLYLPKIQVAAEAALWSQILSSRGVVSAHGDPGRSG